MVDEPLRRPSSSASGPELVRLGHRQVDPIGELGQLLEQRLRLVAEVDLAPPGEHRHRRLLRAELEQDRHIALEAGEDLADCRALVLAERAHVASAAILSPR